MHTQYTHSHTQPKHAHTQYTQGTHYAKQFTHNTHTAQKINTQFTHNQCNPHLGEFALQPLLLLAQRLARESLLRQLGLRVFICVCMCVCV